MTSVKVVIGGCSGATGSLPQRGDRAALESAVEGFSYRPDVFCVANDDSARRYAQAAGAARVDVLSNLSAIIGDWVFIGPGGLCVDGDWLAAEIAERLSAALVFDACDLVSATPSTLILHRDLGQGDRDELEVQAPAVVVFSEQATPRRYVSRYRQQMVSLTPVNVAVDSPDPLQGFGGDWDWVRPRTSGGGTSTASSQAAVDRTNAAFGLAGDAVEHNGASVPIHADPKTCAIHLLRYLIHHQLLPGQNGAPPAERPSATDQALPNPVRQLCGDATAITTRTPRRLGEPAGTAHRRQPRLADAWSRQPVTTGPAPPATPRPDSSQDARWVGARLPADSDD